MSTRCHCGILLVYTVGERRFHCGISKSMSRILHNLSIFNILYHVLNESAYQYPSFLFGQYTMTSS